MRTDGGEAEGFNHWAGNLESINADVSVWAEATRRKAEALQRLAEEARRRADKRKTEQTTKEDRGNDEDGRGE